MIRWRAQRMRALALMAVLAAAGVLAGCGSTSSGSPTSASTTTSGAVGGANAADVQVIQNWARALRSGNVEAAARYFAIPSVFINGPDMLAIRSSRAALLANISLSCGAKLVSITPEANYLHAVFTLTNRPGPGGGCGSGVGAKGATDFVIAGGRISHWIRAPIREKPRTAPPKIQQGSGQQV